MACIHFESDYVEPVWLNILKCECEGRHWQHVASHAIGNEAVLNTTRVDELFGILS